MSLAEFIVAADRLDVENTESLAQQCLIGATALEAILVYKKLVEFAARMLETLPVAAWHITWRDYLLEYGPALRKAGKLDACVELYIQTIKEQKTVFDMGVAELKELKALKEDAEDVLVETRQYGLCILFICVDLAKTLFEQERIRQVCQVWNMSESVCLAFREDTDFRAFSDEITLLLVSKEGIRLVQQWIKEVADTPTPGEWDTTDEEDEDEEELGEELYDPEDHKLVVNPYGINVSHIRLFELCRAVDQEMAKGADGDRVDQVMKEGGIDLAKIREKFLKPD